MRRKIRVYFVESKHLYFTAIFVCLAIGCCLLNLSTSILSSTIREIRGKKVIIDAGHGGFDPGAKSAKGLLEKELNLDVAKRLMRLLSKAGVKVMMIRETDIDFSDRNELFNTKKRRDLYYRIQIANQSDADVLLSIHANSFPQIIYRGAQTFYKLNDENSKLLAECIQNSFNNNLGSTRKARPGDYRILNDINLPGVTIEIGFLSNPQEALLLSDPQYRERVADAIYTGLVNYFAIKD
ncbi:MAG TPA: N-acetylmuramoyl-L-alanine amidase [Bacillota bacterium]|nr:N-acetylmuramoyl-L-alanine amidase [Bacillota bacterium]HOL09465.1 N-acetylmuramoyl-L-alanine amidase [Bacillota bacterium]HPO97687.1 N-acetylmuramoyl-L-alanine amidase [Bacillota bacterium]